MVDLMFFVLCESIPFFVMATSRANSAMTIAGLLAREAESISNSRLRLQPGSPPEDSW